MEADAGIPGWFVGFVVLAIALGIGTTLWRVSVARRIARANGLDPRDATAVTLLDNDGLSATYLSSGLRRGGGRRSTEERLADLEQLRAAGSITDDEYHAARRRILDGI